MVASYSLSLPFSHGCHHVRLRSCYIMSSHGRHHRHHRHQYSRSFHSRGDARISSRGNARVLCSSSSSSSSSSRGNARISRMLTGAKPGYVAWHSIWPTRLPPSRQPTRHCIYPVLPVSLQTYPPTRSQDYPYTRRHTPPHTRTAACR